MPDWNDRNESLEKLAAGQARIAERIDGLERRLDDMAARLQRIGEAVARLKLTADNIRAAQKAEGKPSDDGKTGGAR
ncbi:hypothetical protein [Amphiplicatus metriothermophilus]|uniref:hypothetical protein n=1 Tax=Amphiplicatus metriothermophilus TaxID=1519374 RepID=UPI000B777FEA|nr:hypothetical protein [Amphiplicatus metriothermophilus]MBB5519626.1 prefoldin subunit 5 [Amphiplicatus metriothermophilus]